MTGSAFERLRMVRERGCFDVTAAYTEDREIGMP
jgi:hypothetical protein